MHPPLSRAPPCFATLQLTSKAYCRLPKSPGLHERGYQTSYKRQVRPLVVNRTNPACIRASAVQMTDQDTIVPSWYTLPNLYADTPKQDVLGPHGSLEVFTNPQGLRLTAYFWPASTAPRAVVVMAHGHGCSVVHEYLHNKEPGKAAIYKDSLMEKLNSAGYSVAAVDMQGCGFSEGVRCYVDRYQDYVTDTLEFTKSLEGRPKYTGLPRFIMGTSLGGCISVTACQTSDLFKGAVLVAPMLSLERVSKSGLNPYLRPLAGLISFLFPKAQIARTERNVLFPDIQRFFDEDPQMWTGWTRARNAQEYLTATEALCANMASVKFPFICFHGEDDTMTDPEGSKKLYNEAQSEDKELHIIPGRWHVLLKEPGNQELAKMIVQWIADRI